MTAYRSTPGVGAVLADRYEIVRHIAQGGMGEVFEASDRVLQRQVAVKVFRAAPAERGRFDAEVTTLAALNHPGLVHVFDAGEHGGDGFVVLELVDGPDLRTVLSQRGSLPPREVAGIGATVAAALAYVHEHGIVHRDVTPANVLCGRDGRARLADFGIARLLDTTRVTAVATTIGTAAFLAPEQVEGREVTPAADVYALGLVLLEALAGRVAFEGPSHAAALARLLRDPDVHTGVPAGWSGLLAAMTARDPSARPAASAVAAALAEAASRDPAVPPVLTPGTPRPSPSGVAGPPTTNSPEKAEALSLSVAAPALSATAPLPAAASGGPADATAPTEVLGPGGGTAVLPAALRPRPTVAAAPAGRRASARGRRALWAALAVLALVVGVVLASAGGGVDVPAPSTTTAPVAVTTPPTTTTVPPTTERAEKPGKGNGKGNDKGHDD